MTKPIKPSEVTALKASTTPAAVFEAFNELIAQNFSRGSATVKQNEVVAKIIEKLGVDRGEIFRKGWLNVGEAYRAEGWRVTYDKRAEGWRVTYDKPGYNETYEASFLFEATRKHVPSE